MININKNEPWTETRYRILNIRYLVSVRGSFYTIIRNLDASSVSGRWDYPTKITTHMSLPVTSQSNCVVIFVANRIGDPEIVFPRNASRDEIGAVRVSGLGVQAF